MCQMCDEYETELIRMGLAAAAKQAGTDVPDVDVPQGDGVPARRDSAPDKRHSRAIVRSHSA